MPIPKPPAASTGQPATRPAKSSAAESPAPDAEARVTSDVESREAPDSASRRTLGLPALALLGALFGGLEWMVLAYRGGGPAASSGVAIGAVIGFASLLFEVSAACRQRHALAGTRATLRSFVMRLAVILVFGGWFARDGSTTDVQAFCLAYVATFFVYLCWLTWWTATAPPSRPRRGPGDSPRAARPAVPFRSSRAERLEPGRYLDDPENVVY